MCGDFVEATIDPKSVRFSQNDMKAAFRDPKFGTYKDLAAALNSNPELAATIKPIRLVEREGMIFSLDNRRLMAFQEAGVNVPYVRLDSIPASQLFKFSTTNDGVSIRIRG